MGKTVQVYGMVHGFTVAFQVGAIFLLVGALILLTFVNVGKDAVVENEGVVLH
jgi:hypothetical protein